MEKKEITPINGDLNEANKEVEEIKDLIYTIRGKQVMLDSDVTFLYGVETKYVNRVVKRNMERFPEEFCFQLSEMEIKNNWCQFVTSSKNNNKYRGKSYLPYAFTEQGIAMMSALLKSNIAVQISIKIMKAFVEMKKFVTINEKSSQKISNMEKELLNVNYKLLEHDQKFEILFKEFEKKNREEFKEKIFFEGQIWDSYILIINIIKKANNKITIMDNYIDDSILDMLSKKNKNVEVIIITSEKSNISKLDITKFNKEYPRLRVIKTDKFHDRFMIIDDKELYHIGASLKDLGKKCFGINKMEDVSYIERLKNII